MPNALITGFTGQDGSYLAELLLEKGYKVYGLVRRTSIVTDDRIRHLLGEVEIVDADLVEASEGDGALDAVLKLAYVAWPWVRQKLVRRAARHARYFRA